MYLLSDMASLDIYAEFQGGKYRQRWVPKDLEINPPCQMRFNQLQEVEDIKRVFSARLARPSFKGWFMLFHIVLRPLDFLRKMMQWIWRFHNFMLQNPFKMALFW